MTEQLGFDNVEGAQWQDPVERLNLEIAEISLRIEDITLELKGTGEGRQRKELQAELKAKQDRLPALQEELKAQAELKGAGLPPAEKGPVVAPEEGTTAHPPPVEESHPSTPPAESLQEEEIPPERRKPDDPHKISQLFREQGYVVLYSTVIGDHLAWIRDESYREKVPQGIAAYTEHELEILFGDGVPPHDPHTLRLIHEAKKAGGAEVAELMQKLTGKLTKPSTPS